MEVHMTRLAAVAILAFGTGSARLVGAQIPDTLPLPGGGAVEILGLHRWTLPMLQDSLARYAPGVPLQSHACAAVLRYRLRFADAASMTFEFGPDQPRRIIVSVREPQDSVRVRYRMMPLDTTPGRPEWRRVTALIATRPGVFWRAVQAFTAVPGAPSIRYGTDADSAAVASVLAFLHARTAEDDRAAAQEALSSSPKLYDRMVAALILANFPDRDDSYWALAETLRETDGLAKGVAGSVLLALARRSPRTVDWMPVADGIRAMLDGTSLFELPTLLEVLTRTNVGPAQARAFLHGGGEMLITYLGSRTEVLSSPSHALLVRLRGADLGALPGAWRAWISSL